MAENTDLDIDLHPPQPSTTLFVNQFELESLYQAHAKTCSELSVLKAEHEVLQLRLNNTQEELEWFKTQFAEKNVQLDGEKAKVNQLSYQVIQQFVFYGSLLMQACQRPRPANLKDSSTQIELGRSTGESEGLTATGVHSVADGLEESGPTNHGIDRGESEEPAQTNTAVEKDLNETETEKSEIEVGEKLRKLEALYDLVQQENKSLTRAMTKLNSKLRILCPSSGEGDSEMESCVTIRKQGRFMVERRNLECQQCRLVFGSKEDADRSTCSYHKMNAVPQDGSDGRKLYWLCCSQAVNGKGRAIGCFTGKHRFSFKRRNEE